jgi:ubiquinone/menaquinone biosynthesis C-methylase UbiE
MMDENLKPSDPQSNSPSGSPSNSRSGSPAAKKTTPKAPRRRTGAASEGSAAASAAASTGAKKASTAKTSAPRPATVRKQTARKTTAAQSAGSEAPPTIAITLPSLAPAKAQPPEPAKPEPKPAKPEPAKAQPAEPEPAAVVSEPVVAQAAEPVVEPAAVEPASAADVEAAWNDNRLAQVLYHDWEAGSYDEKWSISFDDRCISYARDRFSALVGPEVLRTESWPYQKSLEIGAGTGFFSLNLRQAGVLDEVHVSDVSAGMVESAKRNATGLGFAVTGAVAGAEELPYPDGTFDLVIGHAVIHHIPDVEAALREVLRVLRPGGRFVIAGEPTKTGDWYARRLGRATWKVTTAVTQMPRLREKWARSQEELDASSRAAALEAVVDLHTFVPDELRATAQRAGAEQVHTQTEELLAAFLGWPVRTFEAAVNPKALGYGWSRFAYTSWQRLSAVDRVLSRGLPESIFYNVGITGIKPAK